MKRMISVWLPHWPIERMQGEARRGARPPLPDEAPFALIEAGARGLTITALNAAARREGLYPGLGLADARARIPGLLSEPAAPERDAEALPALARWCGRYSPALNVDGPDGLWIDATGVAHLFGGDQAMLDDIRSRLAGLGITARLGLADTLAAAWALARFGPPRGLDSMSGGSIEGCRSPSLECMPRPLSRGPGQSRAIPPDRPWVPDQRRPSAGLSGTSRTKARDWDRAQSDTRARLFALPVEGLRLSPDTVTLLKRLGLYRIGQLAALPRANLQSRFRSREAADAVLLRLDQALGMRSEPRAPLAPAPDYAARLAFPEPLISSEAFEGALDWLTGDLCAALARDLRGARRVLFTAYRSDGTSARVAAGLSAPSRTPAHLMRLLGEKVSAIDAGFGIDCLTLWASATERLDLDQESLAQDTRTPVPGPLIDRLANRLACSRVVRAVPRASHVPERAERHAPALQSRPRTEASPETRITAPRPPLLFVPPEPITVIAEIPEGPPARFTWRRVKHRILKAEGPERITPEWWREIGKAASRPRDYYRIEDEAGRRYWVFREGLYGAQDGVPDWYLHGVFV